LTIPKDPQLRQRRNKLKPPATGVVLERGRPPAPVGLVPSVVAMWNEFWGSELAPFIRTTDMPALKRLFHHYDELERVRKELKPPRRAPEPRRRKGESFNDFERRQARWRRQQAAAGRLVHDDRGGVKVNPLARYALEIEERINALEDRFGFSMKARQQLGLNELKARTLQQQNALQFAQLDTKNLPDPREALVIAMDQTRRRSRREGSTT
jgi:hypothetical protein